MYKITSDDIKNIFLNFFEEKKHLKIPESSIIPKNDPTLLYINSGMAPLKDYFTGDEIPPNENLCNIQPCIRTIDIDEIGDRHHLTSFEMLGSWSINNYFKKDAITLAFELLTKQFKIPKEKLYATIFMGSEELGLDADFESIELWKEVGLAEDHIVPQPFEDNFWGPTSENGPCGPCTEVFYDTGEEFGSAYIPGGHFDTKKRYIEIWNAGVFMQYNKNAQGQYEGLKFKSVDTGAGLERLTMTLNNLDSVYEIDSLRPLVNFIKQECQRVHGKIIMEETDIHILTDHLRTVTILFAAEVIPNNTGRGYIPRKLIRKCCNILYENEIKDFNFKEYANIVIGHYAKYYPHFEKNKDYIIDTLLAEKNSYVALLRKGKTIIEKSCNIGSGVITGKEILFLVTTHGLSFDWVKAYAEEHNLILQEQDYLDELKLHKEISKVSIEVNQTDLLIKEISSEVSNTIFTGFDESVQSAVVLKIIKDGECINGAKKDEDVIIITNKTSFYATGGGQVCDKGIIKSNDVLLKVTDVKKINNIYLHYVKVMNGEVKEGTTVNTIIDVSFRSKVAANHSAVHLLQKSLRDLFGDGIKQAGSYVADDRLRFDFYYEKKLEKSQINDIEIRVNSFIKENLIKQVEELSFKEAAQKGALAFFESKYTECVRMVKFGDVSLELCGGTHVDMTGKIGFFKIISEESTGRGVRRITALTGIEALQYVQKELDILDQIANKLKVDSSLIVQKLESLELKKNSKIKQKVLFTDEAINKNVKISETNVPYVVLEHDSLNDDIRNEALKIADAINGITIIYNSDKGKLRLILAVDKNICKKYDAREIFKKISSYFDGKGGGSSHLVMGGGENADGIKRLIEDLNGLI